MDLRSSSEGNYGSKSIVTCGNFTHKCKGTGPTKSDQIINLTYKVIQLIKGLY